MKRKKVTMQDIADQLNVSKVTVSKALNYKEGVGNELRRQIQYKARKMGYQITARDSLPAVSAIQNVAIFMNEKFAEGTTGFYLKLYQALSVELRKWGYLGNLITISQNNKSRENMEQLLLANNIRGIILLGEVSQYCLKEIKSFCIPCILVDFYDRKEKMDCVVTENIYSTYEITNHLFDNGHKEIGFVGSVCVTTSIQDRYLGYCRCLIQQRIPVRSDWVIEDRNANNEPVNFVLPRQMPTAFVCNCDDTAYQFIRFLNQQGYQIPKDISIVSFDNDIHAELCEPKLTTVEVDYKNMAKQAVKRLIDRLENPDLSKQGIVYVKGNIIYRDSVKKI